MEGRIEMFVQIRITPEDYDTIAITFPDVDLFLDGFAKQLEYDVVWCVQNRCALAVSGAMRWEFSQEAPFRDRATMHGEF
jgi:hypothetical protein